MYNCEIVEKLSICGNGFDSCYCLHFPVLLSSNLSIDFVVKRRFICMRIEIIMFIFMIADSSNIKSQTMLFMQGVAPMCTF